MNIVAAVAAHASAVAAARGGRLGDQVVCRGNALNHPITHGSDVLVKSEHCSKQKKNSRAHTTAAARVATPPPLLSAHHRIKPGSTNWVRWPVGVASQKARASDDVGKSAERRDGRIYVGVCFVSVLYAVST